MPIWTIGNEINYIHKSKLSITLKYHSFEVVTFEILDFEGQKCEEVDFLVVHVLNALLFIFGNNIKNIYMTKISATLKWKLVWGNGQIKSNQIIFISPINNHYTRDINAI